MKIKFIIVAVLVVGMLTLAGCGTHAAPKVTTTITTTALSSATYVICVTKYGHFAIPESGTWVTVANCNRAIDWGLHDLSTYAICQGTPNLNADTDALCTASKGAWSPGAAPVSITSQWLCSLDGYFWNPNGPDSYIGPCLAYPTPTTTTTTTSPIALPDSNTLAQALTSAFAQIGDTPTQQQLQSFVAQEDAEAEQGVQVDPQADATAFADQSDPEGVVASNAAQWGNVLNCMIVYTAQCAAEGIPPTS